MGYKKNPVWDMTPAQKDKYMKDMIKRWKSGEEVVPLPSDLEGPHMRVKKKDKDDLNIAKSRKKRKRKA